MNQTPEPHDDSLDDEALGQVGGGTDTALAGIVVGPGGTGPALIRTQKSQGG